MSERPYHESDWRKLDYRENGYMVILGLTLF